MVCNNCGAPMEEGQNVCTNCGADINSASGNANANANANPNPNAYPTNPDYLCGKDRTLIVLLTIFFGQIGVPYFMLGETKKAIIRLVISLCTFGLGAMVLLVFNILDAIKMNKGEYVVDTEKWF